MNNKLSPDQIKALHDELVAERDRRNQQQLEGLTRLSGAELIEALPQIKWLSWMTPGMVSAMRRADENRLKGGGGPTVELKASDDQRERIPGIVPVEFEDLTELLDRGAQRRYIWIQPSRADASKIEESWFISSNSVVALCESDGKLTRYIRRLRDGEDEVLAAKELLRRKVSDEWRPMSGPIQYLDDGIA